MRGRDFNFKVCFLELNRCLADAVFHGEWNGGIFMSVSSLQRQKKMFFLSSKFLSVTYVGVLDDLGIKNRCIVFFF